MSKQFLITKNFSFDHQNCLTAAWLSKKISVLINKFTINEKKTNRKSIYSSVYDLFPADLSSLIVSNFNWLCLQKKNFRFWGFIFNRLHKNRFNLSVFWYGISFRLFSLLKWYNYLKSIWHTLFKKWPILWFNTISW